MGKQKKESFEQAKTKQWLQNKLGAYVAKSVVFTEDGNPDLIGCFRSVFFGIEMKRIGKKTTEDFGARPLQNEKLRDIAEAGGIAFVAETLDEVKHTLYNELVRRGIDTTPLRVK